MRKRPSVNERSVESSDTLITIVGLAEKPLTHTLTSLHDTTAKFVYIDNTQVLMCTPFHTTCPSTPPVDYGTFAATLIRG